MNRTMRPNGHRAGPLFGALLLMVTAALAFTPVVPTVGAIDPTLAPSEAATSTRKAPKRGPARCWIVRRCVMTVVLRPSVPPGRGSRPGAGRRLGGPAWRRPANDHLWKLDQGRTGAGVGPTWVPAVIVPVGS